MVKRGYVLGPDVLHVRWETPQKQMEGTRLPHWIRTRRVHYFILTPRFIPSLRVAIMANTLTVYQQLLNRESLESHAMRTDGVGTRRKGLQRQGVRLEGLASWVDKKEKEVEKLQEHIDQSKAKLLTAEREIGHVEESLSEEERKRYESGQSVNLEALETIKDALTEDPGLLDGLMRAMPNLPLPSSLTAMLGSAKEAKEVVSRLKPGLCSLVTQVADARNALKALKKQIQEEAVSRATAAELEEVQQEFANSRSTLEVQIRELEAMLKKAEANAAAYKSEASQKSAMNSRLRMDMATEEGRGEELESLANERKMTSKLERELQMEQTSRKALVLVTHRGQGLNVRLNRELDSLTDVFEATEALLDKARASNSGLRRRLLRSQSDYENLSVEVEEKTNALDLSRQKVDGLNGDIDKLREEMERQSEALAEQAEVLEKVKTLAGGRREAIVVLRGEKRRLTDEGRVDRTKIQRLEVEKTTARGELAAFRSGTGRLLKSKESLQHDLSELRVANERLEVSESTLRFHLVGARAKLGEVRAERNVLLGTVVRSRSTVERLEAERSIMGKCAVGSLVKVKELQAEKRTLSDSLDESRTAVARLGLSETKLLKTVQKLEVVGLGKQGEASVDCFEQFLSRDCVKPTRSRGLREART